MIFWLVLVIFIILLSSIKQINQYQRGVKFTLGKYSGLMTPGWKLVLPIFQSYQNVDIRTKAVDVPEQEAITQDNVSTKISAVMYYRITEASKAVLEVESYNLAGNQLAQTTMRNVVGETSLNDLLAERDAIATRIRDIVSHTTTSWGIEILTVELKDINLPENMKRTMAKAAEAQREKQATIINSEGEVIAAKNLAAAAQTMASTPGALHLRTLNSINDISSDDSNTVVFAVPLEVLRALESIVRSSKLSFALV